MPPVGRIRLWDNGTWRPAIKLPDEVRAPPADAVLAFLLEEGLARRKFEPPTE
jgi:hypothetical protein